MDYWWLIDLLKLFIFYFTGLGHILDGVSTQVFFSLYSAEALEARDSSRPVHQRVKNGQIFQ